MTSSPPPTYNERSWAIDVITQINHLVTDMNRPIRRAGGESSIRAEGSILFPDVLLFRDPSAAAILQGWELKMPDTGIDDADYIKNAREKAQALGLDSFLLWNVRFARLYVRDTGGVYAPVHTWSDCSFITDRADVQRHEADWKRLLSQIISHLNDLFDSGRLQGRQFIEAYSSGGITDLILQNAAGVAAALQQAARADAGLNDGITLWWSQVAREYALEDRFSALARANLMNWTGKFLFAHVLREQDSRAAVVSSLASSSSPTDALNIFGQLSASCNFWTIFQPNLGQHVLTDTAWSHLLQLNALLSDLRIGAIDQTQLAALFESLATSISRKLQGQYATPPELARLLACLTLRGANGRFLDACCGSGTIPRAALELKIEQGLAVPDAVSQVWASDIDPQVLQLATFALAKPGFMGCVLRVFPHDAFALDPSEAITFRDPSSGQLIQDPLGLFQAIGSNLPFVAQEGRQRYQQAIDQTNARLVASGSEAFSGRADVAAYLPFILYHLLEPGGRLGIIITNAWLGTAWGDQFRRNLTRLFEFKAVVTSGAGRWFRNSDVVANLLVMEKRQAPVSADVSSDEETRFVVLKRRLEEYADTSSSRLCAAQIEQGQPHEDSITVRSVSHRSQKAFAVWGLAGSAQFVDCDWVKELPLVPLKSLFSVRRGERRGWDPMFYPASGHGIEPDYVRPVLKSSRQISSYSASAESEAFCCSRPVDELEHLGHHGALAWIRRFEHALNNSGRPLPEALARSGLHWYEMRDTNMAELVIPLNFGNRIFISRLNPPAFVNQRLVALARLNAQTDLSLAHALLNSTIAIFMMEGMGFGRGLGVLDLNKDRFEDFMHILDPGRLSPAQADRIRTTFAPIQVRDILEVADELDQADRQAFDDSVLAAFGITAGRERIYDALRALVSIRQTALEV